MKRLFFGASSIRTDRLPVFEAACALGVFAVILAWPLPVLLGRARWPSRAPALALLLWQSIALAGGLSMIGAFLTFGLIPFGQRLGTGLNSLFAVLDGSRTLPGVSIWFLLSLCVATLLGVHLVANLILTITSTERQRRRHRQLLHLLALPAADLANTRVIDTAALMAYCVPGVRSSITVVSEGLRALLDAREFDAVIAHEKAHAAQRHDLLLIAFRAWHISLPWFPTAYQAEREVSMLVEMLADDRARKTVEDRVLASAIALVATSSDEPGFSAASGLATGSAPLTVRQTSERVSRLTTTLPPLPRTARSLIIAIAAGLITVPTVLLVFTP